MIVRESIADDDRNLYNRDIYRGQEPTSVPKPEKPDSSLFLKPKSKAELERIKQGLSPEDLAFAAIRNNNLDLLKYAIEERKANLMRSKPYRDFHELHLAIRKKNYEMIRYLLSKYPLKDNQFFDNSTLEEAINTNDIKIAKLLLKDKRVNPWGDKRSSFFINAIDNLNFEMMDLLLKDGRINPIGIEEWRNKKDYPMGIKYDKFSPLGAIDWKFRQHEKSKTSNKWKKYHLTDDQIKKLQEVKDKLYKILEKNEKKGLRFARGREVYQSTNGSFKYRFDKDAWGYLGESEIFKPKSEEEIRKSLMDKSPEELINIGMYKDIEEPILWALEKKLNKELYQRIFLWAINKNKARVFKKLLDLHIFEDHNLQHALETVNFEITKMILDHGIIPTNDALNRAILDNQFEKVQLFLQYPELDPSLNNRIALSLALANWSKTKDLKILKLMINDPRIRASLDSKSLAAFDKSFNVPVKENLLYIIK